MKTEHVTNLTELKEQTKRISELTQQLEEMRSNILTSLKNDHALNEARKCAFENIKKSPDAVREEIRFMREIIELFSDNLLTEEAKKDKVYSKVVMNEHNYFEYWLEHPELKETAVSKSTLKHLSTQTCYWDLPVRILNCLRAKDCYYAFEVVDKNPKDFLNCMNMGKISLKQLTDYVKSLGLEFEYKIRYSEDKGKYYTLTT